ncbi:MAG: nucleotide-diphospho-sugar transferase [Bacteroidota bacterium]
MKSPILFLIYNRPEHTGRVFEAIRKMKPEKLYVAADGPKKGKAGDSVACEAARAAATLIDWPCELKTFFREDNVGLSISIPEAIDWFFENEQEGIILEDDCLPSAGFFRFCEQMLDKYRGENRIAHINGSNFLLGKKKGIKGSYYFSNIYHPWGWATWKRSWLHFDGEMNELEEFITNDKMRHVTDKTAWRDAYYGLLTRTKRKEIDTWDYAWYYSLWKHQRISVTPSVNLVCNIGFGSDATNTNYSYSRLAGMKAHNMHQISEPNEIRVNRSADDFALNVKFNEGKGTIIDRIREKLRIIIKN